MAQLRRIVMVRHGETVGNSSVRFHGSTDVELSDDGRAQMRRAAHGLRQEPVELVVASPLRRSWEAAKILAGSAPVRLESDFREIHFGRWEGLTKEEIEASDPILYRDWQERAPGFDYPSGEPRAEFEKRVERGFERLEASGARAILLVVHKGVIRTIAEKLFGHVLEQGEPPLAGIVGFSRAGDGTWTPGRASSNPPGVD